MKPNEQATAFDSVAHWHDKQGRRFRSMAEDYVRIDEETCVKAGDASRRICRGQSPRANLTHPLCHGYGR